jgi:hypothetical protein
LLRTVGGRLRRLWWVDWTLKTGSQARNFSGSSLYEHREPADCTETADVNWCCGADRSSSVVVERSERRYG